ncbi:electron transport complex subunit RsxC [Halonatronum saccharophilum]|uniref:electron transport complex subunit RsxC n=1 Tax=Halonatronum saccharophilum TaxID=150060 RepID=UPI00047FD782|nr:electron transport complex subunit RsxC [Halonatronum saccharophilum]
MKTKTFKQGIHPKYNKDLTNSKPLEKANLPKEVTLYLDQHIGSPAKAIVEAGDKVKLGDKVGESTGFISANLHASISGEITAIEERRDSIVIKIKGSEGEQWQVDNPEKNLEDISAEEIREIIKEAGIVGLGGAAFPSHVKVSTDGKEVNQVILNGAECEPYLTVDHRTMLEQASEVIYGLKALMKSAGAKEGYIGVEVNKMDAINKLEEVSQKDSNINIIPLEVKYPQGGEKQLIKAILDKEVPSGGLPLDIGVVVNNVGTAVAVTEAINYGKPLIERGLTVTGAVNNPQNLIVRIGTPIRDLIEECGGFKGEPGKIILGGPMTGQAQSSLDVGVSKGTSGILVLSKDEIEDYKDPRPCIRCARCIDGCPAKLMPTALANLAKNDDVEGLEKYNVLDCIECGSCTYVCPANIDLLDWIRIGKAKVEAKRREN